MIELVLTIIGYLILAIVIIYLLYKQEYPEKRKKQNMENTKNVTRIAINGFGRIGRLAFKDAKDNPSIEIVAINDLTKPSMLAYLLKYDTTEGRYPGTVEYNDNAIIVDGKEYKILSQPNADLLPWYELNVDVVLECTGFYANRAKSMAHIRAGAKHVLINAPAGKDVPTVVYGVNQDILNGDELIVSGASCTTNCLAPVAKVLNDKFKIVKGWMNTIHAVTPTQNLLDGPNKDGNCRRARAAMENIVPTTTGAAKALGMVIPELDKLIDGSAQRVPVKAGSLVLLSVIVSSVVTAEEVNTAMRDAANETLGYTEDEIVSSDTIGMKFGSLFDGTQTKTQDLSNGSTLVNVAAWYDNESSYTAQYIRTANYLAQKLK